MPDMKILYLDIETSPNVAYVWGLRNQNVGLSQLVEPARVISAAYSWDHQEKVNFVSEWDDGRVTMLNRLHSALDAADAVVHYNGASFDIPHLNREFLEVNLGPPAPFAQIDLYRTVRKMFRFPTAKLAHLGDVLELGEEGKLHTDMSLWVNVLAKDKDAQREMKRYNIEDVVILKDLYTKLKPWVRSHPNVGLYTDGTEPVCISCGSDDLEKRGFAYTNAGKFQRYVCLECGRWMRGATRVETTPMREVKL